MQVSSGHSSKSFTFKCLADVLLTYLPGQIFASFKIQISNKNVIFQFADALNRIECYRDMFLKQTEMLGVEPLLSMSKELKIKKVKETVGKIVLKQAL